LQYWLLLLLLLLLLLKSMGGAAAICNGVVGTNLEVANIKGVASSDGAALSAGVVKLSRYWPNTSQGQHLLDMTPHLMH
jgi:hypothetical protein